MKQTTYKFERFLQPEFPVYSSVQSGRAILAVNHYHSPAEIMQVLEGRVQALVGTSYRVCEKGDILFIPPSAVHEVNSLTEDAAIQGITFEMSLINHIDFSQDISEMFHISHQSQYLITREDTEYETMCECIRNIRSVYGNFSVSSKMAMVSGLLLMMSLLIQKFALEAGVQNKGYRKLREVLAFVESHYSEKIQISMLSAIIHVCDDQLIRLFKEVTGETPIEYIMNLRIEAGIKLLSSTELSIAEIAEKTGFGSDTYMARIFKQRLNTTPGKFRHQ